MNQEYDDLFGIERPLIPLVETGAVICANAATTTWRDHCAPRSATYICGNPPYLGSKNHKPEHKADFSAYFGDSKYPKNLDYISLWFLKSADYIRDSNARAALVSTNSVCQGQHVGLLWPLILDSGIAIDFAHTSFEWSNGAVGAAGVTCIVVGLTRAQQGARLLFSQDGVRSVKNINPYLVASADNTIVTNSRAPLSSVPPATLGSMAKDGNHLSLTQAERDWMVRNDPRARKFIKPYRGSSEMLNAQPRFCLWIDDNELVEAQEIDAIRSRLDLVEAFRSASKDRDASKFVDRPHRFVQRAYRPTACIGVPGVSSDRREYVPMEWFQPGTVLSHLAFTIHDAEPWLLALLQSKMHTAWVRAIGGKMRDAGYRYSNTLCYNTFPFPYLGKTQRTDLGRLALEILAARERWPDRSLAELYDPDAMPANLRAAHDANDEFVDGLYRSRPFASDSDRMELLLDQYRELLAQPDETSSQKEE